MPTDTHNRRTTPSRENQDPDNARQSLEVETQNAAEQLNVRSHAEREVLREDLRLGRNHPGECVAFLDVWMENDQGVRNLTRAVIAHATSWEELEEQIHSASLTNEQRQQILTLLVDHPETAEHSQSGI